MGACQIVHETRQVCNGSGLGGLAFKVLMLFAPWALPVVICHCGFWHDVFPWPCGLLLSVVLSRDGDTEFIKKRIPCSL